MTTIIDVRETHHRQIADAVRALSPEAPIRVSTVVEILLNGAWVGGYEVRRVREHCVTVIDRAEGFFSKLIDVPNGCFRLPESPDPIMRDDAGNMWRA